MSLEASIKPSDQVETVCDNLLQPGVGQARVVVAIAGPPASGKSTLAAAVVQSLNTGEASTSRAVLLPMDGFHLDNRLLSMRGLLARKGAPETFDADGFCALMHRLRRRSSEIVFPVFDRRLDIAIAGAGVILPTTKVVVVEGNYLLMPTAPWGSVHPLYDRTVFLRPDLQTIEQRLMDRWRDLELDERAARRAVEDNDLKNASTVLSASIAADITFHDGYA